MSQRTLQTNDLHPRDFPPELLARCSFGQVLDFAASFPCCWASPGWGEHYPEGGFLRVIAWSANGYALPNNVFDQTLNELQVAGQSWFGLVSYEAGLQFEGLKSDSSTLLKLEAVPGFVPDMLVLWHDDAAVSAWATDAGWQAFLAGFLSKVYSQPNLKLPELPVSLLTAEAYHECVKQVRHNIEEGETYELNYCVPFTSTAEISVAHNLWWQLVQQSPAPFACYFQYFGQHLLCLSPERFLKLEGDRLISQPIKGTSPRFADAARDQVSAHSLAHSLKEQAENMMIVDLVRHDLSGCCKPGTVQVQELMGLYAFPQVHQLISTISGVLETGKYLGDAFRSCFPMGSMTGAPKRRTMELISKLEVRQRGWFSGSAGYVMPGFGSDFNVVIRSLLYDHSTKQLALWAGSAITWDSDPEQEWQECLLKAQRWLSFLQQVRQDQPSS